MSVFERTMTALSALPREADFGEVFERTSIILSASLQRFMGALRSGELGQNFPKGIRSHCSPNRSLDSGHCVRKDLGNGIQRTPHLTNKCPREDYI
jgi:hypothetical protein